MNLNGKVDKLAGIIHSQSLYDPPNAMLPKMRLERRIAAYQGTPPPFPQEVDELSIASSGPEVSHGRTA